MQPPFVVFDLEANADRSSVEDHEILEIGACRVVDGAFRDTFSTLVRPTRQVSQDTIEITGLAESALETGLEQVAALEGASLAR